MFATLWNRSSGEQFSPPRFHHKGKEVATFAATSLPSDFEQRILRWPHSQTCYYLRRCATGVARCNTGVARCNAGVARCNTGAARSNTGRLAIGLLATGRVATMAFLAAFILPINDFF